MVLLFAALFPNRKSCILASKQVSSIINVFCRTAVKVQQPWLATEQ